MPLPAAHIALPGTAVREGVSENCRQRVGFPGTVPEPERPPKVDQLRPHVAMRCHRRLAAPRSSPPATASSTRRGAPSSAPLTPTTRRTTAQVNGITQTPSVPKLVGWPYLGNLNFLGKRDQGRGHGARRRGQVQTSPLGLQARRRDPEGERAANTHQDTPTSTTPFHPALPAF